MPVSKHTRVFVCALACVCVHVCVHASSVDPFRVGSGASLDPRPMEPPVMNSKTLIEPKSLIMKLTIATSVAEGYLLWCRVMSDRPGVHNVVPISHNGSDFSGAVQHNLPSQTDGPPETPGPRLRGTAVRRLSKSGSFHPGISPTSLTGKIFKLSGSSRIAGVSTFLFVCLAIAAMWSVCCMVPGGGGGGDAGTTFRIPPRWGPHMIATYPFRNY